MRVIILATGVRYGASPTTKSGRFVGRLTATRMAQHGGRFHVLRRRPPLCPSESRMCKHGMCVCRHLDLTHRTLPLTLAAVAFNFVGEATTDGALTLTYFDGAGRAELTRLALAAGGIE